MKWINYTLARSFMSTTDHAFDKNSHMGASQ